MARLWSQDSFQPPLPTIPVIVDTNWLETVPGSARTMDSGVAQPQPVNLVSKISINTEKKLFKQPKHYQKLLHLHWLTMLDWP